MTRDGSESRRAATRASAAALCALLCVVCVGVAAVSAVQDDALKESRRFAQEAAAAYKEKDYAAYLTKMKRASELRPDHPTLLYNLAGAHAVTGEKREALAALRRVAAMGMAYEAEKDTDFDSIKDSAEFKSILERFAANRLHVGNSAPAFTLREKGLVTESVAYDPLEDRFYISGAYRRKIVRAGRDGEVVDFATEREGLWGVLGMKVDARRRHLWVTTGASPQMANYREEENGTSAVFKFDLKTGRLLKKYVLPNRPQPHALGDLVVNARGDVYATDSRTPAVYVIPHERDEIELLTGGAPFVSPQGLDFSPDGRRLFVADYSRGVFALDLKTKQATLLNSPADATLLGIDGLYFHRGSLVAIQNGTRPHRVVRLHLSRNFGAVERVEVLEANHPQFDEPTLGVLVSNDFYYVANSQYGAIGRDGQLAPAEKLREHVILKLKL